ncbi:MAG: DUF5118 domain-containing protein, partial [Pirellulales bacterium]
MNCLSRIFARFPSMLSAALCGAVLGAMLTSPTLARADDESSKKESADSFSKLTADAKRHDGLLPLYRKEDKLYAEIPQRLI